MQRGRAAVAIGLALIVLGLAGLVWLIPAAPMTGDGQHYIEFVRNNLQHGASSWHERRLLGPFLVRLGTATIAPGVLAQVAHLGSRQADQLASALFPTDAQAGFFVLTVVSLAVTAWLTYVAAREVLGDEMRALIAIPLLFGTWVVAPNLREYGLVDPLAWVFVAGIWLATLRKQWWLAAILGALGVVAKEVVALAAVVAAVAAMDVKKPWLALGIGGPAVGVVLLLTILVPGSGTDAGAYLGDWVRKGLFSNGVGRAVFLLFASYGALWLLLPRAWSSFAPHVRRAALVFFVAAPLLPLVGSPERMEEAIFPVVISAALLATRTWSLPLVWALALGSALFAARIGGDARLPTIVAWSGLALACALATWAYAAPLVAQRRTSAAATS